MGRRLVARVGRFLSNHARLDGPNEISTNGELIIQEAILREAAGEPLVILDVGANIGEWSLRLMAAARLLNRSIAVHAFEPTPETANTLRGNISRIGAESSIRVTEVALSSEIGERAFYSFGANEGRNSLHDVTTEPGALSTVVMTTTLDRYCAECAVSRIHLLKVDTEGHDLEVLKGAIQLFRRAAIDVVQFEYNHRWISARHFLAEVFDLLQPYGYRIGKVTPKGVEYYKGWHYELETFREGNFVAVSGGVRLGVPAVTWWMDQ